jgi:SAM-dependent methyltransferase
VRDTRDKEYFDKYADYRTPTDPIVQAYVSPKLELIRSIVPLGPDMSILDVGCGNGVFTYWLRRICYTVGVDLSDAMMRRGGEGTWVCGDAAQLPFADNSFDVVWCANLLHHTDDPAAIIGEMKRTSRAYVVLIEPNRANIAMFLYTALIPAERRATRFSRAYLARLVEGSGLHVCYHVASGMITQNRTPGFLVPALRRLDAPGPFGAYQILVARV